MSRFKKSLVKSKIHKRGSRGNLEAFFVTRQVSSAVHLFINLPDTWQAENHPKLSFDIGQDKQIQTA